MCGGVEEAEFLFCAVSMVRNRRQANISSGFKKNFLMITTAYWESRKALGSSEFVTIRDLSPRREGC